MPSRNEEDFEKLKRLVIGMSHSEYSCPTIKSKEEDFP